MTVFYMVVRILLIAACCTAAGASAMHMLQAQRYQTSALRKDLRRYGGLLGSDVLIALAASLLNWYLPILLSMAIQKEAARETLCNWLMLGIFLVVTAVVFIQKSRIPQRKPFTWTRRICRLMGLVFVLNLAGTFILHLLTLSPYLMFVGVDYVVLLAALILRPIEDKINTRYYKSARRKLAQHKGLVRIGITGSYGKTQTKLILKTLLSEKYRVLVTPPNFSTAMGISRVIHEQLNERHQVFIAEMGAQRRGEIREMARLMGPHYGAITCIGNAHLETFGSPEAVAQAKYELIQSLPEHGIAFFGSDCGFGDRLYALCKKEKYRAGLGDEVECFMSARQLETGPEGSSFELVCADGEQMRVKTRLLGSYNARNIALAAAMARKLGLSMEEIARGIEKLKPFRHQLQRIPGDIIQIDDSENTLPEAAAEALRVLSEFPGRRIVVTAGLTDLDVDAEDKNFAFGTQMDGCADYVVLIGPEQTRAVMRGLMSVHYPKSSVRIVRDEADAAALVKELAAKGYTVLYEGILPQAQEA